MTSDTYKKVKSKRNMLNSADAKKAAKAPGIANTSTTISDEKLQGAQRTRINTNTTAVAARREKITSKPQALHTRIPAILGFDTREKFTTIAATTASRYPVVMSILTIILVTSMFMLVVVNAVNINKMKLETTQMNGALEVLIEKEGELSLELEKRDDLRYIREVAVNQYGMIDKKHVTKYYINLDKEPKVEILEKTDSKPVVDGIKD